MLARGTDSSEPVPDTTDAPAPTFYSGEELAAASNRIAEYTRTGTYPLPRGGEESAGQRAVRAAIDHVLAHTGQGPASVHVTSVRAVEDALSGEDEATAQVRAVLAATYANGGDNDLGASIAGAEHLLLDLELLYARWA